MALSAEQIVARLPKTSGRYLLAYSGGQDSAVLLELLLRGGLKPVLMHVHHALQREADTWLKQAKVRAQGKGLDFVGIRLEAPLSQSNLEACAREGRYQAFREHMQFGDVLITAHHQRDQAETLLYRLFRGAGVDGLSAMKAVTEFEPGLLARPLLNSSKEDIEAFAEAEQLSWIEDPANQDTRFDRVWLRQSLIPAVRLRWPELDHQLRQTAAIMGEAAELLAELAEQDLEVCMTKNRLSIPALLELSQARQHNLLHYWLGGVSRDQVLRVQSEVIEAAEDGQPLLQLEQRQLRRYRDELYLMDALPEIPDARLDFQLPGGAELPANLGQLATVLAEQGLPAGNYQLEFGVAELRLRPQDQEHERSLKKLCQEQGIPPWVRQRLPVLYKAGKPVAIADYWLAKEAVVEGGYRPLWQTSLPGRPQPDRS